MKSNVIIIDNQGNGFDKSLEETRKVADYEGLSHKESLQLQLCAEEMLSMDSTQSVFVRGFLTINVPGLEERKGNIRITKTGDSGEALPDDLLSDLPNHVIECLDPEWDKYEQSTLKRLAETIRIGIRGDNVDMTVTKRFA